MSENERVRQGHWSTVLSDRGGGENARAQTAQRHGGWRKADVTSQITSDSWKQTGCIRCIRGVNKLKTFKTRVDGERL